MLEGIIFHTKMTTNLSSKKIGLIFLFIQVLVGITTGSSEIKSIFVDGDLKFTWTRKSVYQNVSVACDGNLQTKVDYIKDEYTVADVLNCTDVNIIVRTSKGYRYGEMSAAYKPQIIYASEGDSVEISLPDPTGISNYTIYKLESKAAIKIDYQSININRYILLRSPGYISLQAAHVTTFDAGYYSAGYNGTDSKTRQGVVLVVFGRPSKPIITGKVNVPINEKTTLTCNSNSTSAPLFYKKIPAMKYMWFVNNTKIPNVFNQALEFNVMRKHLYDNFTCQAQERLISDSNATQIKPLYGPEEVGLIPAVNGRIRLRDRGLLGPFNCTSDCNPSCVFHWVAVGSDGQKSGIIAMGSILPIQIVNKKMKLTFRCMATGQYNNTKGSKTAFADINVDIQYGPDMVEFSPKMDNSIIIRENSPFGPITCSADCNPLCDYEWESINFKGQVASVQEGQVLPLRLIGRNDIQRYRCIASGQVSNTDGRNTSMKEIQINVAYVSEPIIYTVLNGKTRNNTEITAKERDNATIVCKVDGYPTPNVLIVKGSKTKAGMAGYLTKNSYHYTFTDGLQCNDSDTYICIGSNQEYGETSTKVQLFVECTPRLDTGIEFYRRYLTATGKNNTVDVRVPIISHSSLDNALRKKIIYWDGNSGNNEIKSTIQQRSEPHGYWIESLIPVFDQNYLGNYTLFFRDHIIVSIFIEERENGKFELSLLNPGAVIAFGLGGAIIVTCFVSLMTFRRRRVNGKEPESLAMNTLKQPRDLGNDGALSEVPHHQSQQIAQISRIPRIAGSSQNWFSDNMEYEVLHHYSAIVNVSR